MKIEVDGRTFKGIGELKTQLHTLLKSYASNQELSKNDLSFLIALMTQTEHGRKKIGNGISKIVVEDTPHRFKGFTVYRVDGSRDDFSYKKIVPCTSRKKHSNHEKDVIGAFRDLVRHRDKVKGSHIHHDGEPFSEIYQNFLQDYDLDPEDIKLIEPFHGIKAIKDQVIRQNFIEYHDERAILVEMTAEEHRLIHCPNCGLK
jgi:hypothetical protein